MLNRIVRGYSKDKWNIGVFRGAPEDLLDGEIKNSVSWPIAEMKNGSYADPFVSLWQGEYYVFFEELHFDTGRSKIVCSKLDLRDRVIVFEEPRTVLERDYRVTYPCLFRDGEALYMCPETAQNGRTTIYSAKRFPYEWKPEKEIVVDAKLLDPTIVRHGDLWWLFAATGEGGGRSRLCLYYSDELFGRWSPHAGNPVKADNRSTRPGGQPFGKDGVLYRPAQNCETTYGQNLVINRILKLSPDEFEEETVAAVLPSQLKKYRNGLHHVSYDGELVVFDAKRFLFPKNVTLPIERALGIAKRRG
jgi:hypothetical protein